MIGRFLFIRSRSTVTVFIILAYTNQHGRAWSHHLLPPRVGWDFEAGLMDIGHIPQLRISYLALDLSRSCCVSGLCLPTGFALHILILPLQVKLNVNRTPMASFNRDVTHTTRPTYHRVFPFHYNNGGRTPLPRHYAKVVTTSVSALLVRVVLSQIHYTTSFDSDFFHSRFRFYPSSDSHLVLFQREHGPLITET